MDLQERDFSEELTFQASRSSGPGGQNVNKVSSKIELRFNVRNSRLLSEDEKSIILEKLDTRITKNDEIILVAQANRSQLANKEKVIEKFYTLLEKCLKPEKKRFKTKPTRSSVEKRLQSKKIQSLIKAYRKGLGL
jgi:ribosome-associated protein